MQAACNGCCLSRATSLSTQSAALHVLMANHLLYAFSGERTRLGVVGAMRRLAEHRYNKNSVTLLYTSHTCTQLSQVKAGTPAHALHQTINHN